MTENLLQVIITGIFTLLGTLLGAIGSNLQAAAAAKREKEQSELQRKWSLRDFARDRRLAVRDERCQQAEDFIDAMSEDFHQFRNHAIWINTQDPNLPPPDELKNYAYWQHMIDKNIFCYGPVIIAISTNKLNLEIAWEIMKEAWNSMAAHYAFAYKTVIVNKEPIPDPIKLTEDIDKVYSAFNKGLRDFYVTIDKIKSSRLR